MVTPCRHVFHSNCLEGWMRFRLQCPNCRYGKSSTSSLHLVIPTNLRQKPSTTLVNIARLLCMYRLIVLVNIGVWKVLAGIAL